MLDNTLLARIKEDRADEKDTPSIVAAKDPSNAERQRRYRARKRNGGGTVTAVTRNAVTPTILVPEQAQVSASFNADGDLVLTQANWPDDDVSIIVARGNVMHFVDALTDAVGVPTLRG